MQTQVQSHIPVGLQQAVHHCIVIIGGGSAGITVAARLSRVLPPSDIAIIEPSRAHYYQPLWTLVGGGVFPKEVSKREESAYIPPGTTWLCDAVTEVYPNDNYVLPASYQVNFTWLQEVLHARAELAEEHEFRGLFPGCETGAEPPFGNLFDLETLVDTALTKDTEIVFNAGSHWQTVKMRYEDYARLVHPRIAKFAEHR